MSTPLSILHLARKFSDKEKEIFSDRLKFRGGGAIPPSPSSLPRHHCMCCRLIMASHYKYDTTYTQLMKTKLTIRTVNNVTRAHFNKNRQKDISTKRKNVPESRRSGWLEL